MTPEISIIIPAVNEESCIRYLLKDIENQTFQDFEIIVADYNSTDRTREIAESFGAKIALGGTCSVGRNNGAKMASGNIYVFFDADVRIRPDYLERGLRYFKKRNLDIGGTFFYLWHKNIFVMMNNLGNNIGKITRKNSKFPALSGDSIWSTKEAFEKINGFDESLNFGEDEDYGKRAVKNGLRYGLIPYSHTSSGRRIEALGLGRITKSFYFSTKAKFAKNEDLKKKFEDLAADAYGGIGVIK